MRSDSLPGDPVRSDPIRVSAVVLRDPSGRVLTVRKRGTHRFQLPGGKPDAGETAAEAGARECAEEVGVTIDPVALVWLGTFTAAAANEAGREVVGDVFVLPGFLPGAGAIGPCAEIDEIRWLTPVAPFPDDLANLLRDHALPAVERFDREGAPG